MTRKSRTYFTLAIYEDKVWSPQFGDYSHSVVADERDDSWSDLPIKATKILKTNDDQASIDFAVQALNAKGFVR